MSVRTSHGTSRWQSRAAVAALSTCALLAATVSGVAHAAPESAAAAECPEAYPLSEVIEGLDVTGLTVSNGTQPDPIAGVVVGRIKDGIAPGIDMIIARMSGSEITDPATGDVWRGIWAGMSGSPVYAPDGRLIGAVSYGLSYSPSDYAGITPAAEMYRIRDYGSRAARPNRTAEVPSGIARQMRADGVSERQVASGYHQLPMPRGISGASQQRLERIAERVNYSGRDGIVAGFGASADEEPTPIMAGGNLVAAQSYGDVTSAATGTATAVCDGDVIGFGHPAAFLGRSSFSMHGANALFIETDSFSGSFKVSNPTAPVGTVTQDRLAGILGSEGVTPSATVVDSHVSATNGNARDGSTVITQQIYSDDVPYLTILHLFNNQQRVFDAAAAGSATLRWTVDMTKPDGTPLQYTRKDRFASASDITQANLWDVYGDVNRIMRNRFADVEITDISLESSLDERYRAFNLGTVQRYKNGQWNVVKPGGTIRARSGGTLVLRAWLKPRPDSASVGRWIRLRVPVGTYSARRTGELIVSGGESTRGEANPTSLAQLLRSMAAAPTNASVWGQLTVRTPNGPVLKQRHTPAPTVVGGRTAVTVKVVR